MDLNAWSHFCKASTPIAMQNRVKAFLKSMCKAQQDAQRYRKRVQGPAESAKFMLQDMYLRAPTSAVSFCAICYTSRQLYALHERVYSAFRDLMAHDTRVRAAVMPLEGKCTRLYLFVLKSALPEAEIEGTRLTSAKSIV